MKQLQVLASEEYERQDASNAEFVTTDVRVSSKTGLISACYHEHFSVRPSRRVQPGITSR